MSPRFRVRVNVFSRIPYVLARMIPVENSRGFAKVASVDVPTPTSPIGGENLFGGLLVAVLAGQSPQGSSELFWRFAPPDHLFVPLLFVILPVNTADFHLLPDQSLLAGLVGMWLSDVSAVHDAVATDIDFRWGRLIGWRCDSSLDRSLRFGHAPLIDGGSNVMNQFQNGLMGQADAVLCGDKIRQSREMLHGRQLTDPFGERLRDPMGTTTEMGVGRIKFPIAARATIPTA